MPLVAVGVLLLLLKLAEFGPVGDWSWWWVLAPFAAAAVWWQIADSTGYTQRKAIQKMEKRKVDRRDRALEALGQQKQNYERDRQVHHAQSDAKSRRSSEDAKGADRSASEDAPPRRDPTR